NSILHSSFCIRQRSDDGDHIPKRFDPPRLVIRNGNMKVLLDGEEDGQRVERVDSRLGQRGVEREVVAGKLLLLADDVEQLLRDLVAGHGAAMIPTACAGPGGCSTSRGLRSAPCSPSPSEIVRILRAAAGAF